jgi:porin
MLQAEPGLHGRFRDFRLQQSLKFWLAFTTAVAGLVAAPVESHAACDLSEADVVHGAAPPGILQDAVIPIDPGGVRRELRKHGIEVGAVYYGEVFHALGGLKDGSVYDGVFELYMNADMHELGLWKGLCFHADGYQIHGRSITGDYVGGLMPVSGLEAEPSTRLFEVWFEQHFFNDSLAIKIGQLAADAEFFYAEGGGYFLNGTWGWAPIAADNNPSGGPAYPLATPGARLAVAPTERTSLSVGIYNGDPAPQCSKAGGNPQRCNDNGLDFELDDDPLLMVEGSYSYELARGTLPGTIKIGGWNHFGDFEHQRIDVGGELIAVTGNAGRPLDNDHALYVVLDQLLWRKPGSEDAQGLGLFTRFASAPDDRNLVDFYFDVGLTFTGMIPSRPRDALAIGYAYTSISDQVSALNVDTGLLVPRDYEALIEVTYTTEVVTGWTLQPDFQYIINPEGGVEAKNATVIGVRSTLSF